MGRNFRFILIAILITGLVSFKIPVARAGFLFPLKSKSPHTTPLGKQDVRIGVTHNNGERLLFQKVDRNRKLTQLPSTHLAIGLSRNVEILLEYSLLYLKQKGENSKFGSGDLKITGVYQFLKEGVLLPLGSFNFGVKVPNADDIHGFGTDESDVFFGGFFSKRSGDFNFILNADFALLGNPLPTDSEQDDVFRYSIAGIYPLKEDIQALIELEGIEFSHFGNNRRFLRGGFTFSFNRFKFDIGGAAGLNDGSGNYQIQAGITLMLGKAEKTSYCPCSPQ